MWPITFLFCLGQGEQLCWRKQPEIFCALYGKFNSVCTWYFQCLLRIYEPRAKVRVCQLELFHDCKSIYLYCYCLHVYLNQVIFFSIFFGTYTSEGVICTCLSCSQTWLGRVVHLFTHPLFLFPLAVLYHVYVVIRTWDGGLVLL